MLLLGSLLVVAVLAAVVVLGAGRPSGPAAVPAGSGQTAVQQLATLAVRAPAPQTGYSRGRFGDGWVDTDRNGCGTRDDVLARDLRDVTHRPGSGGCVVAGGELVDPYGGARIAFVRGPGTSEEVQVDHVVALSNAWRTGAQGWDAQRRTAFANDPLELLAVDGSLNAAKGDGDAATWLPPASGFRCRYVARQVAVKAVYGLWVTPAEQAALARVLSTCPAEPSPAPTLPR